MAEEGSGGGAIRELLAIFGFGIDTSELKRGESALNGFFEKVKKVAEGVAAVFAVEAIESFVESNVRAMTAIEHTATQLGISTDEVQSFQFAAKSLGLEADSLVNSMGRLQVAQQAAASGSKQQAGAFAALGVHIKDSNGKMKEADQLFVDVAEGISKIEDPSKQAAEAVKLFGRQGRQLLPILKEGAAGIDELIETYHELGGGYSDDVIKKGAAFEKQSAKLSLTLTSLKNTILRVLLPVVTKIVEWITAGAKWFGELAKSSNILHVTLATLASVAGIFAIQMALAAAPILLMAAAVGALILVFEDIYTFLTGGESEIGDIIDKIFGKGTSTEVLNTVKGIYHDIKDTIMQALDAWRELTGTGPNATANQGQSAKGKREEIDQKTIAAAKIRAQNNLPLTDTETSALHRTGIDADRFIARYSGTSPELAGLDNSPSGTGSVVINLTGAPGMTKEEARDMIGGAFRQRNRAAAATLPRHPGS